MTYFGFLIGFVVLPIAILGGLTLRDARLGRTLPAALGFLPPGLIVTVLAVVALIYTTPWDNYLVATGVWTYDRALVTGVTVGWVPLEEYTFFVLQSALTGLWFLFLARRQNANSAFTPRKSICLMSAAVVIFTWLISMALLISGWKPGNYLSLELVWALPPIALQLAVGADILWHYRRLVIPTVVSTTIYLGLSDALAIRSGTWAINPQLSTGIFLGGILPLEEAVFFLLTTMLLVFGITLGLANESFKRLPARLVSMRKSG